MDLIELSRKPASYKFSPEEIKFIKKKIPKNSFKAKYALYNKESKKGCYIGFFIDGMPRSPRRSGVENHWDFIAERPLSNREYEEEIQNFGCNNRRFQVWMYDKIEHLIEADLSYGIKTPEDFVAICKKKGYSGDIQLKINFENE